MRRANAADANRLAGPSGAGRASESGPGGAASSAAPEAKQRTSTADAELSEAPPVAHAGTRPADHVRPSPGTPVLGPEARAAPEDEDVDSLELQDDDMDSHEFEHSPNYELDSESDADAQFSEGKRARLKAVTEVMHDKAESEEMKVLMATAAVTKILKDL